jgi:translation initiation factor 5A
VLETEPTGVLMSYKNSRAGDLKVGSYALIDNEPCQIVDIEKSKPGKHGSAKIRASGISLFDGKKKTYLAQADAGCQVPLVDKRSGQIVSITPGQGVQLMDLETYETTEIAMPTDEEIAGKLAPGKEVEYWVIMGRFKINRVKS